jgi:hypothetical protein
VVISGTVVFVSAVIRKTLKTTRLGDWVGRLKQLNNENRFWRIVVMLVSYVLVCCVLLITIHQVEEATSVYTKIVNQPFYEKILTNTKSFFIDLWYIPTLLIIGLITLVEFKVKQKLIANKIYLAVIIINLSFCLFIFFLLLLQLCPLPLLRPAIIW